MTLYAFQTKLGVNLEAEYKTVETKMLFVENVEHPCMKALKYLFTLQSIVEEMEELVELNLLYVLVWVNHRVAKNTIVDLGATRKFMTETKIKC